MEDTRKYCIINFYFFACGVYLVGKVWKLQIKDLKIMEIFYFENFR